MKKVITTKPVDGGLSDYLKERGYIRNQHHSELIVSRNGDTLTISEGSVQTLTLETGGIERPPMVKAVITIPPELLEEFLNSLT